MLTARGIGDEGDDLGDGAAEAEHHTGLAVHVIARAGSSAQASRTSATSLSRNNADHPAPARIAGMAQALGIHALIAHGGWRNSSSAVFTLPLW
ncbi:MAG: hypothetical protein IPM46_01080 [Flavobacteriales bacterium]|nr:hypothetical protein [Flavobacteriales bacterium]